MRAPARFFLPILVKKNDGRLAVVKGAARLSCGPLRGPSRVPGAMYNIGRLPSGVRLMYKIARAAPSRRHRIQDARTSEDENSALHGTRAPCGVPVHRTEPGSLPHGTRPAPLRCVRFVDGRLAITLHLFSPDTARVPYNM